MTKPMKTEHLPSGSHGNPSKVHGNPHHTPGPTPEPTVPPVSGTAALQRLSMKRSEPKVKLTPEEIAAGKTPNSGKLKKDGTPVPGQSPEADAARAAERAAEAAAGDSDSDDSSDTPDPTPSPTPAPAPAP